MATWTIIALGSGLFLQQTADRERKEREQLKSIAYAYLANRQAFSRFTCRFTATFGTAQKLKDALAGRYDSAFVAQGFWAVDGPEVRYESLCDLDLIPKKKLGSNIGGVQEQLPSSWRAGSVSDRRNIERFALAPVAHAPGSPK